jgi:autotransporter-associated beta strand protein
MRKSRAVALICGSAVAVCGRFALADTPLAVSYDDFAGTPRSDAIDDPTTGPNSWQGWGNWNGSTGVLTPETSNYLTGETLSFSATSLAGSGPTVNGLLDTPNDYAATNPDPDYAEYPNGFGGLPGVLGEMTINNYAGGYDQVQTGDFQPGAGGAAFAAALKNGQCLAVDFTSPDGGTNLPSGYMTIAFATNSNATTNISTGGANPGKTLTAKDSGAFGDDAGSFCVNNGTYFTAYIPYSDPTFNPGYGQFNLDLNSSDAGNVTISNIRIISSTWATSGGGSWTTNASPTTTDWIGGLPGGVLGGASGASAQFEDLETGNTTATLDQTWTLGTLIFDTLQYTYNVAQGTGGGSLVMDNTINSADAVINDTAGGSATSGNGSAPNYTEYVTAPVQLNSNTDVTVTRSTDLLQITGNITGTGALSMSGAGTLQLNANNTYSGGTTVNSGTLLVSSAGSLPANKPVTVKGGLLELANGIEGSNLALSALTISGGKVQVADNVSAGTPLATSNVNIASLSITGNGTLDIGNNRIIIDYAAGHDPIASIASWVANGYADDSGHPVAGPAIISSDIAADDAASGYSYGIGYGDSAEGVVAGLAPDTIEIMFTLLGDANLDGTVNGEDFSQFSSNLGASPRVWDDGDFNYDGTVNGEDFALFSHNAGQTDTAYAAATGPLELANGLNLASVPEPASMGLAAIAGLGLLARRRRSSR